jgi:hypothetical protein
MTGSTEVPNANFIGLKKNGKGRIYEMTNNMNKNIKFRIEFGEPEYEYKYAISVIKPRTYHH